MSGSCFVDTNILVYARDSAAGEKHRQAKSLVDALWASRRGRLSVQVLNEYFVTVTRKLRPGLSAALAWEDIHALSTWQPVALDWPLLGRAHRIFDGYSLSWWDSLVIAAAEVTGAETLYSEDLAHGERFGTVRILNPFHPTATA